MFGKTYESMYKGSMVGAGLNVFAVWNYIITNTHFGVIELNPKLLRAILGGELEEVEAALAYLSRPDPESRSKDEDGRRIVKEGQFQYRVVNWEAYQEMRNADDLREYNRRKQAEYRAKIKQQLAAMTPEQRERFEAGRKAEYGKRRKSGGLRAARKNGELAGARQAISEGLAEAQGPWGNGSVQQSVSLPASPAAEEPESIPLGPREPEE